MSVACKTRGLRPGWAVVFNHPLLGNKRIHRGLSTRSEVEADLIVFQLNLILKDTELQKLSIEEASKKFYFKTVEVFYGERPITEAAEQNS